MYATINAIERKCTSVDNDALKKASSFSLICPLRNFSIDSIYSSMLYLFLPFDTACRNKVIEKKEGQPCDCPPDYSLIILEVFLSVRLPYYK